MKYELVIWDFNGTIIDDVQTGIDAVNVLLGRRGLPLLTDRDTYRRAFRFPIVEYYKVLGFDFEKEPYETAAYEWVAEYERRIPDIPLVPGIEETLRGVRALGLRQMILSSSELAMMKGQLERYGLLSYFDDIRGLDNIFAGGKTEMAKAWSRGKKLSAVFVGDTTHDFETAQAISCDCVLFAGGHGRREALEATGAPVIETLPELLPFLSANGEKHS